MNVADKQRQTWGNCKPTAGRPRERRWLFFHPVGLSLALFLTFSMAKAQDRQAAPDSPRVVAKVIIPLPQVVVQRAAKSHIQDDQNAFESVLSSAANSAMSLRGFPLAATDSLGNSDISDWLKQLRPLNSRLARGVINDEAQQTLGHLGSLPEEYLILVQYFRIEEGSGGSYNPLTGGITSATVSTLLQAALISTRTTKVVWKNELLERKLFRASDPKFANAVNALYETLGNKKGIL
jgi:hypothetical protein